MARNGERREKAEEREMIEELLLLLLLLLDWASLTVEGKFTVFALF